MLNKEKHIYNIENECKYKLTKEEERPHEQLDEDLNNELDQYVDELNKCLQEKESKAEEL